MWALDRAMVVVSFTEGSEELPVDGLPGPGLAGEVIVITRPHKGSRYRDEAQCIANDPLGSEGRVGVSRARSGPGLWATTARGDTSRPTPHRIKDWVQGVTVFGRTCTQSFSVVAGGM